MLTSKTKTCKPNISFDSIHWHRLRQAGASRGTCPGWKSCAPAGSPAGKMLTFSTLKNELIIDNKKIFARLITSGD